jgi:hypothetical protein
LGIEDGKPFNPDKETERALLEGLDIAYDYMQKLFIEEASVPYWDKSNWLAWSFPEGQAEAGFPLVTDTQILIDERARVYFFLTYFPVTLGGSTFYLTGLRDSDSNLFDGESTYKLHVPEDTPAEDFWSAIVYSMEFKGFIFDAPRVGISDKIDGKNLQYNNDGSVDIYFGPNPPEGFESNTIPTGVDFFLLFRLYGPGETVLDKSWKLGDVEKIN